MVTLALGWFIALGPRGIGGPVQYVMVSGASMEPGLHTGDLVLARESGSYEVGDTVAFRVPQGEAGAGKIVIHRIVGGDGESGYLTKGDNRAERDQWRPTTEDIVGERWLLIPRLGYYVAKLRSPLALGAFMGVLVFLLIAIPERRKDRGEAEPKPGRAAAPPPPPPAFPAKI